MSSEQQYSAEQKAAVAAVVSTAAALAAMYGIQLLTLAGWRKLLEALFPLVTQQRNVAAASARRFYDTQRQINLPTALRHDILLPATTWDGFVKAMEPARREVVKQVQMSAAKGDPVVPDKIARPVVMQTAKVVQDAGRDTIVKAADTDRIEELGDSLEDLVDKLPDNVKPKDLDVDFDALSKKVVKWARKATGEETCGWCWMLVSRGPVYSDAASAGLRGKDDDFDDYAALEQLGYDSPDKPMDGDAISALESAAKGHMQEWHTGCDCIAVPVFDRNSWPGKDDYEKAEKDWVKAFSAAKEIINLISEDGEYLKLRYKGAKRDSRGQVIYNDKGGMIYKDIYLRLGAARSREAVNAMRILQEKGPDGLEQWLQRRLDRERRALTP